MLAGVPALRMRAFARELRASLRVVCERGRFRVVHDSLQRNHLHLLVGSAGKENLGRGMKAISSRVARAVQRVFDLSGPVLHGGYHLRILRTPREVRNALAHVLRNARKHWRERHGALPPVRPDEASSGRWFDGWRRILSTREVRVEARQVASPRTWLLSVGWRCHGLIDPAEMPGASTSP